MIDWCYLLSAIFFIVGLKMLGSPLQARKGNLVSALGMLLAIITTLYASNLHYTWIIVGLLIGTLVGIFVARTVSMTAMPEMVALFNGFGGGASLLVGWAEFHNYQEEQQIIKLFAIFLTVVIGGITFSGSMIAFGKLAEKISGKPIIYAGQRLLQGFLVMVIITCGIMYFLGLLPNGYGVFLGFMIAALLIGIFSILPIGGADMPVVIALLNSYSGIAACAAGFVISNTVLIVAGALVGASGLILTNIMCKAMNRSLSNVIFGSFGTSAQGGGEGIQGEVKAISPNDVYFILEAASSIVFVPGYGMAVAQAQHVVRELGVILENEGKEVKYAIHPVAGRMPGHMNVLLAEANVPYEQLVEPDDINPIMETTDICIVIGANDVVNPAARDVASSPIYGMPIIEVDRAKTVLVLKRSMATGFAGIDNPLFFMQNTRMLFGDAKSSISKLISEMKDS